MTAPPPASLRQRLASADRVVGPLVLFVALYAAALFLLTWLRLLPGIAAGLVSVSVATAAAIAIEEDGRWPLGLFVSPRLAAAELLRGLLFGSLLIGACALAIVLTSGQRHAAGSGFPWFEVAVVYVPAVLHEELLFRGYGFQKLHRRSRWFALLFTSFVFAALHAGNSAATLLGLLNVGLGGLLLGLAWERFGRLWFPIGLHLAWNVMSGPVLGHEVSGWSVGVSLLRELDAGPSWLTGGAFGIEGSVWMTVGTALAILVIARRPALRGATTNDEG